MLLTEVKLNEELWPRSSTDKSLVNQYAEIFEELPPIAIQKRTGVLIDGWHRFYAASKLGLREIPTEEVDVLDKFLFAEAVKRNIKHGLHLSPEQREKAIVKLNKQDFSAHEIARLLGISHITVSRVLKAATVTVSPDVSAETPTAKPTVGIRHRVAIAEAPEEKKGEIVRAVVEKALTEKETKVLVDAMTSPLVTEQDRDAMLYDKGTRPYLRDQKGEVIQSADSAMRAMAMAKKHASQDALVKFWKTLQKLDRELSDLNPQQVALNLDASSMRLALETSDSIIDWLTKFKLEIWKVTDRQTPPKD